VRFFDLGYLRPRRLSKAEYRRNRTLCLAGKSAQRRVTVAGGVARERLNTDGLPKMVVILSKIKNQTGESTFPATLHGKFIW